MKRCPQCEFIYEDDQSLCDMDGVLLVFDSRTLPNHALATVPPTPPTAHRRNRAVPAFATLILALVLGMVYYVSTRQTRPTVRTPSTLSTAPIVISTPEPQPTQAEEPTQVKEEEPAPPPVKEPVKQPATAPAKKSATTKNTSVSQTKPATEPKKDDSKVNSILKKTGRILKKPFKF
jgi:outer membrane biosynthesis protein TonB